jgi:hypothetical protein
MANRTFNPQQYHLLYKRVVCLMPVVSFGGTGAPTLKKRQFTAAGASTVAASSSFISAPTSGVGYVFGDGVGTRSIARTGSGAYTLTLNDPYQFLLGVEVMQVSNVGGTSTPLAPVVVSGSTTVTTNTATGNGGVIAFVMNNSSGSATDPASGDTYTFCITLVDATEP